MGTELPSEPVLPDALREVLAHHLAPRGMRRRVRVGVITGAGISADSGIPTYRGEGGLYDDPTQGDLAVEALSLSTLQRDPDRTWRVVADLARQSVRATPNAAHRALAGLEARLAAQDREPGGATGHAADDRSFLLLTQNVDGLHQRAGSQDVLAIHGDVLDARCMGCPARLRLDRLVLRELAGAPRCAACGGVMRPDAVLFGEMLPERGLNRLRRFFLLQAPTIVLAVGTSALFPYITEPMRFASLASTSLCLEVNPEPSAITPHVDLRVPARAVHGVPALVAAILGHLTQPLE